MSRFLYQNIRTSISPHINPLNSTHSISKVRLNSKFVLYSPGNRTQLYSTFRDSFFPSTVLTSHTPVRSTTHMPVDIDLLKNLPMNNQDLPGWLDTCYQEFFAESNTQKDTLAVLGNESADLDSSVCALSYAYVVHLTLKHKIEAFRGLLPKHLQSMDEKACSTLVVPMLNIPEVSVVLLNIPILLASSSYIFMRFSCIERFQLAWFNTAQFSFAGN